MLRLKLAADADRFIATRQPKHQRQIAARIQLLREQPHPSDAKMLKGEHHDYHRADVGEYRIIYRIEVTVVDGNEVDVLHVAAIGKRNDDEVYRRFSRKD